MDFETYLTILVIGTILFSVVSVILFLKKLRLYKNNNLKFRPRLRYFYHPLFLSLYFIITFAIGGFYLSYLSTTPRITNTYPQTESILDSYDKPIEINFNMPVNSESLNPNLNPIIEGQWIWEPFLGIQNLTKRGYFYPNESLFPKERIVLYITGIEKFGVQDRSHEGGIVFDSANLPEIVSVIPENKSKHIEVNQEIFLEFDKPTEGNSEITFEFKPEIDFTVNEIDPKTIKLTPTKNFLQSTDYTLHVFSTPIRSNLQDGSEVERDNIIEIHRLKFQTVKEPLIKSISPKGSGVKVDEEIRFRFESEIDPQSIEDNILISPNINGEFVWLDKRTLSLKNTSTLEKATKYTISINPGIKGLEGGISDKTFIHEFETIGKIKIIETSPLDGSVRVNTKSQVSVKFDQEVDKESAQSKFSITPSVPGSFSWDNNTLIFSPSNLNFSTTYSINIAAGVKSIFGIDSDQAFSFSFNTRGQEVIISMPWYPQPQSPVSFTCNIVSAQMALAWKGYATSASGLISEIGYNSNRVNGQWTGNPYKEFVGCSDGFCGYGVYWTALQKLFINRGIQTEIRTGFNVNDLARSIENGRPVIIWRYNGTSANGDSDWVASDGTYIDAISGQHGGVVTGYRGTIDNPTAFYVNDPWFGLIWMNRDTFDYYWSRLNRPALIIY